jgi:hypothetical protein
VCETNKVIRQGFFSHLVEIIAKIRKQTSLNTEQNPSLPSDDSEKIPIGLPESKWLFGYSAGAAQEIAAYDDQLNTLLDNSIKQESLADYWVRPESDGPDTDQ